MKTTFDKITDWAAAYDNRAAVPTFEEYFYAWGRDAAAFRTDYAPREIAYGTAARERLDLFVPDGAPQGVHVFIHGGWWMNFDKSYFSHLAAGSLARGQAVAIPSYTLCPDIRISGIIEQMKQAVSHAAHAVPEVPLTISGHSAGGHLAAMMATEAGGLSADVLARLGRVVSISGVHDLRPLLRHPMNAHLRIDAAEALSASPALLSPCTDVELIAWCGGDETPEFRRQNALLATMWGGQVAARSTEAAGQHHFDVIHPLTETDGALTLACLGA